MTESKRSAKRPKRLPLTSEQYELLLAFEEGRTVAEAAKILSKDASVVSRAIKTLAERAPVLEKEGGRWQVSPSGRQINRLSESFIETQERLLAQAGALRLSPSPVPASTAPSALLLLGTQRGFHSPIWGRRNNPSAETAIGEVLQAWRRSKRTVVFCRHVSRERGSPLRGGTRGCELLPEITARPGERVLDKSRNSAFTGTTLASDLRAGGVGSVVLVGFTTNLCVASTAQAACDEGFDVYVVSDATATFDRIGHDGRTVEAEDLHAACLATLHQEVATVVDHATLLGAQPIGARNS